jgi:hypothetical protein
VAIELDTGYLRRLRRKPGLSKRIVTVRERRTAFIRARSFVALAVRQGQGLRDLYQSFTADRERMASRLLDFYTRLHADEYVFVLALHQACQWVQVVARHDSTLKNDVRVFIASLPDIGDLRDMWEHEVEYVHGRGKRRDRWSRPLDPNVSIMQEATSGSIWVDDKGKLTHRIGGRMDVGPATTAAAKMLRALDRALERLPPLGGER